MLSSKMILNISFEKYYGRTSDENTFIQGMQRVKSTPDNSFVNKSLMKNYIPRPSMK